MAISPRLKTSPCACGYFAVFIGLAGLVVGAIAGGLFAVWRVNRRRARPVA
ncbi:hypothetical protein [Mesorhizobium sp. IMUNJ 23033]|uniref:hypothetical protein n=1 Tax=Mesorhizobium sp. IMUNJ 23033 TaxID=3378039 RepID=UPI00384C716D